MALWLIGGEDGLINRLTGCEIAIRVVCLPSIEEILCCSDPVARRPILSLHRGVQQRKEG
jgi:hypothetical protein